MTRDYYLKSIRSGQQDLTFTAGDFTNGAPQELIFTVGTNGGRIAGVVQNAKGEPAIGATVTLIPDLEHRSVAWLYKTRNADENGRFAIEGVRPGEYKIYAWEDGEDGSFLDPRFMKAYESEGAALNVKEGSRQTVQLKVIPTNSNTSTGASAR